jgi:hypothetical protein
VGRKDDLNMQPKVTKTELALALANRAAKGDQMDLKDSELTKAELALAFSNRLAVAADNGKPQTVSSLLTKAKQGGFDDLLSLCNALSNAADFGSAACVKHLLGAGADPNGKAGRRTPWIALHSREPKPEDDKIVGLLTDAGLNADGIRKLDNDGWTALARAAYSYNPGGVKRNLPYFDVSAEGDLGTPLFCLLFRCARSCDREDDAGECVRLLLAAGANGEAALKTFLSLMENNDREVPDACQNLVAIIEHKSIGGSTEKGKKDGKGGPWI